MCSLKKAW